MEPAKIDIKRGNIMMMNVIAYRCPKCGKELLDVEIPERAFQDACDQEICINTACGC
jgi:hypothetical protein